MIHDLKQYPVYKDSGVPWLEQVPEHWDILRGKNVFRVIDIRSETGEEELLTVSSNDGVVPRSQKTVTMFKAESYIGHKLCWPGDLVINSLWAWMQGLGFSKHHGLVSSAYSVYRPRQKFNSYSYYFNYLLRSAVYKWELQTRSKGVWLSRLQLSDPAFLDMPIIIPSLPELSAIVRYLDYMDRRIRRYIHAKQKLIKLLEEQKQAIIHRAVTRGLDPNVKLKPSGVEWLGDVPEGWDMIKLKRACSLLRDGTHLPPPRQTQGVPLLSVRNIVDENFVNRDDDSFISLSDYEQLCKSFVVQKNDVLLAIVGATLGKVAIVPEMSPFHIQRSLAVFRPRSHILNHEFLSYFLRGPAFHNALWTTVAFSAQPGIYLNTLDNFKIAVPPIAEQKEIVLQITKVTNEIQQSINNTQCEISLLREYRTRLIADVVTGKLDVREAAASLPDELEEPEVLDDELGEGEGLDDEQATEIEEEDDI